MADDMEHIPPSDREARKMNRAMRRQQMRAPAPVDIEPEPDPITCAWCAFDAVFDDDETEDERAKCPACGTAYSVEVAPNGLPNGDLEWTEVDAHRSQAVERRKAFALDRIAGLLSEAFDTFVPQER